MSYKTGQQKRHEAMYQQASLKLSYNYRNETCSQNLSLARQQSTSHQILKIQRESL